jgi:hypothetical protein
VLSPLFLEKSGVSCLWHLLKQPSFVHGSGKRSSHTAVQSSPALWDGCVCWVQREVCEYFYTRSLALKFGQEVLVYKTGSKHLPFYPLNKRVLATQFMWVCEQGSGALLSATFNVCIVKLISLLHPVGVWISVHARIICCQGCFCCHLLFFFSKFGVFMQRT